MIFITTSIITLFLAISITMTFLATSIMMILFFVTGTMTYYQYHSVSEDPEVSALVGSHTESYEKS